MVVGGSIYVFVCFTFDFSWVMGLYTGTSCAYWHSCLFNIDTMAFIVSLKRMQ